MQRLTHAIQNVTLPAGPGNLELRVAFTAILDEFRDLHRRVSEVEEKVERIGKVTGKPFSSISSRTLVERVENLERKIGR
jgi:hypothetical protein